MNKDNQIKELAELICTGCADNCDCKYDKGSCECVVQEATMLYNAGYRKAPEGIWKHAITLYNNNFWRCSECGHEEELPATEDPTTALPYCNCGAKMVKTLSNKGTWRLETNEEEPNPMFKLVVCSECDKASNDTYDFCPNCGTKMYTGV